MLNSDGNLLGGAAGQCRPVPVPALVRPRLPFGLRCRIQIGTQAGVQCSSRPETSLSNLRSARALRKLQECVEKHGMFSKLRNAQLARIAQLALLCSHHKSAARTRRLPGVLATRLCCRPATMHRMDLDRVLDRLAHDAAAPVDVAELALQLARDEYANLDVEAYLSELTGMAHEAKNYLRGSLEARVFGLCRYLFHDMGFRGNVQDYYDPRNSYLNDVLDRRTGLPITLSILFIEVARRAGISAYGLNFPGHFLAL